MAVLFLAGVLVIYWSEARGNPLLAGTDQTVTELQSGGNMEGKEVRFGIANSALFATVTTDASCGAVNAMHDSFTPLGGMIPLANIMLSEVVFGGVGAGLYGILIFIVLSVFIAGLMVGRTPEYLGKKIESYDVKMAMLVVLVFPLTILVLTAISAVSPTFGTSQLNNPGPHGLMGDALRVHFRHRQQRICLRRDFGKHTLVQHDNRNGDARWSLHDDHSDAGNRRQSSAQKDRAAIVGHVSRDDAIVHYVVGERDRDCWCADVFSGVESWANRRGVVDARR